MLEAKAMAGALDNLTPNARACLWVIALNAHDTGTDHTPEHVYYRGWEHLARAGLARTEYDEPAHQAVARAIRELTRSGYLTALPREGRKNHQHKPYRLQL